jgi:hypothetical protein
VSTSSSEIQFFFSHDKNGKRNFFVLSNRLKKATKVTKLSSHEFPRDAFIRRKNYSPTDIPEQTFFPSASDHHRPTHGAMRLLAGKAISTRLENERAKKASGRITRKGIMSQNGY